MSYGGVRRGDLATVALQGEHGRPRPALVIQSDLFAGTATVTVLLLTSTRVDAPLIRIDVAPSADNGLRQPSQVETSGNLVLDGREASSGLGVARRVLPAEGAPW